MKILIAGSRTITDYNAVKHAIFRSPFKIKDITEIVSGHARGVDCLGEQFAEEYDIPIKIFKANWKKYGKKAGMIRNREMIDYIRKDSNSGVIVCYDGVSRGSLNTIDLAITYGFKPYVEIFYKVPFSLNSVDINFKVVG